MPPPTRSICWSCQKSIVTSEIVYLDADTKLPVCIHCWEAIPKGQRLIIAQKFHFRAKYGDDIGGILETLQESLNVAMGDYIENKYPDGFSGRN